MSVQTLRAGVLVILVTSVSAAIAAPKATPWSHGNSLLATEAGPKFFVIGTYVQPSWKFQTWKDRGINTLVGHPNGFSVDEWSAAATNAGFYQIRSPSSNLSADLNNPYLLAWATVDEPSNTTTGNLDYSTVAQTPAEVQAQAQPWRDYAASQGADIPIWTNHVGGHIWPDWANNTPVMRDYMAGPESDWLASDTYQIQNNRGMLTDGGDYTSTYQGVLATKQIEWSGGKSTMTFLGSSAYNYGQAVPTPAQLEAQAWSAIINGSEGIIYFPVALTPWDWDATPSDLGRAMTDFHAEIKAIESHLMNETAGGRNPYKVFHASNPGVAPTADQLPFPFEATEIQTAGGTFRIVLNLSDQAATLNNPEWGVVNKVFEPYQELKTMNNEFLSDLPGPAPYVPPPDEPFDSDDLVLNLSGGQFEGSPTVDVTVDGVTVATRIEVKADSVEFGGVGDYQRITIEGDYSRADSVQVVLTNWAQDPSGMKNRNVYVDYAQIGTEKIEAEASQTSGGHLFPNGVHLRVPEASVTFAFNNGGVIEPPPPRMRLPPSKSRLP